MNRSIKKLRHEYGNTSLDEKSLSLNPMVQFERWFDEAIQSEVFEPNGMVFATISSACRPASRTLLLKIYDCDRGFGFYTDSDSRKGEHLRLHPFGSLTFWWKEIYRQVNIEGRVVKMTRAQAIQYFQERPKNAQIAAYASHQSHPLASREELEESFNRLQKRFRGKAVPCPERWVGYFLEPERIEFWQGRANRLHDRFLYVKMGKEWVISRLSP